MRECEISWTNNYVSAIGNSRDQKSNQSRLGIVLQIQTRADIKIVLPTRQTPLVQHGDHADAELRPLALGHHQRNMKEGYDRLQRGKETETGRLEESESQSERKKYAWPLYLLCGHVLRARFACIASFVCCVDALPVCQRNSARTCALAGVSVHVIGQQSGRCSQNKKTSSNAHRPGRTYAKSQKSRRTRTHSSTSIDDGSGMCKVGVAGNHAHRAILSSIFDRPKRPDTWDGIDQEVQLIVESLDAQMVHSTQTLPGAYPEPHGGTNDGYLHAASTLC